MTRKLRLGVILDTYDQPAWIEFMLRRVQKEGAAEFVLVVLDESASRGLTNSGKHRRSGAGWKGPLYRLLTGARILLMERGTWKRHALDPVDATELFAGISEHKLQTECQLDSHSLADPDLTAIDRSKPDVLLHLGTRRLSGAVLDLARFGCWQYHLADSEVNKGGPPGYWETMESWPAIGSELRVLAGRLDRVPVLCRSWSCTNFRSLNGNNNSRLWTASSFVPRALRRIAKDRRNGKNGSSVFESTHPA
ncbi:MAG: hypothetical protein AAGC91_10285, partial [Pseudomonadota bacterium]